MDIIYNLLWPTKSNDDIGTILEKAIVTNDVDMAHNAIKDTQFANATFKGKPLFEHMSSYRLSPECIPVIRLLIKSGMPVLTIDYLFTQMYSIEYMICQLSDPGATAALLCLTGSRSEDEVRQVLFRAGDFSNMFNDVVEHLK